MPPIQYIVEGGHKLRGAIEPSGNKNSALPIIAAALLTDQPVTLENVPRIRDTETLVELIRSVGAQAEWRTWLLRGAPARCLPRGLEATTRRRRRAGCRHARARPGARSVTRPACRRPPLSRGGLAD